MKGYLLNILLYLFCVVSFVYANSNFADFQYQVDYFEIIGNQPGNLRDEFDDGAVSPWHIEEETVSESGGYLNLSTPGILFGPYEINGASWISERSSVRTDDAPSSGFDVIGGAGDFTVTSSWNSTPVGQNEFYGMALSSETGTSSFDINLNIYNFEPYYANALGIPSGLGIWLLIDTGDLGALFIQAVSISEITGDVLFKLDFDDDSDSFLASYSTDGGSSFGTFSPVSFNLEVDDMAWYLEAEEWKKTESVNCKYLIDGDLNRDCQVDLNDFAILAAKWLVNCDDTPLDPACQCDIPWIAEPPMNVERDQFAGGVINDKIYVFGGNGNPGGNLNSTEMYDPVIAISDPNINPWSIVAFNSLAVEELTAAVVNDKLYVFGADKNVFNEMYDPVTNTWKTLAEKPTFSRAGTATVYNDKIYIFGGSSNDPEHYNEIVDVVECFDPNSKTWDDDPVTHMPEMISNFAIATIGTKAYLFGGAQGTEPPDIQFRDSVITYDFETKTWTTTGYAPMPVKKAFTYANSAPVINGKVYLIGGWQLTDDEFSSSDRVDIYDTATDTWDIGTFLPLPLGSHVTVFMDKVIYIIGGAYNEDFTNRSKREVISYDTEYCSP